MNWWQWFAGPVLAGVIVGMVSGYSQASGRFEGFNWKIGLTMFVGVGILYLLAFLANRAWRYLAQKSRRPN